MGGRCPSEAQRARPCMRAIESGPPDTAARMPEAWFSERKRRSSPSSESGSSGGETGAMARGLSKLSGSAALDPLLLALGGLADGRGGLRILGRDVQELLCGLTVAAAHEIGLAEPEGGFGHQLVARVGLQEAAKAHLG